MQDSEHVARRKQRAKDRAAISSMYRCYYHFSKIHVAIAVVVVVVVIIVIIVIVLVIVILIVILTVIIMIIVNNID